MNDYAVYIQMYINLTPVGSLDTRRLGRFSMIGWLRISLYLGMEIKLTLFVLSTDYIPKFVALTAHHPVTPLIHEII